jgi:hypothetical protein
VINPARWLATNIRLIEDLRGPCFEQLISDCRTDRAVLYAYPAGRPQGGGCGGVSVTI